MEKVYGIKGVQMVKLEVCHYTSNCDVALILACLFVLEPSPGAI